MVDEDDYDGTITMMDMNYDYAYNWRWRRRQWLVSAVMFDDYGDMTCGGDDHDCDDADGGGDDWSLQWCVGMAVIRIMIDDVDKCWW